MPIVPFSGDFHRRTLFSALLDAREQFGGGKETVEDYNRQPLTYDRLVLGAGALSGIFDRMTVRGEAVGLLLPSVAAFTAAFFALQSTGRVAAMLNFTAGLKNLLSALATAQISTVITSRAFIETAKLDEVVAGLSQGGARIVYLEDVRGQIGIGGKLTALLRKLIARPLHERLALKPDDPAVILFTSGSEGTPKGVVLSHSNILANVAQVRAHVPLETSDVLMNPLPVFHSFGLTVGTLLPIYAGIKVVLYPSPLHYRIVPKLIADAKATILLGTDTFLTGYSRACDPDDLKSLRLVVSGAERVKDETRKAWEQKTSAIVLEGYGATECSPVISASRVEDNRAGTVGWLFAGMEMRTEPVQGLAMGGRLHVRGPNVMLGYMKADKPGVLEPPEGGWHDTGDIVAVDPDGVITIQGRAKRFAKIGGEMVSLAAVESYASACWPGNTHVVVSLPDVRKGEQLVLITDRPEADRGALLDWAKDAGVPELMLPKAILVVQNVPVLGSGKIDYGGAQHLAQTMRPLL